MTAWKDTHLRALGHKAHTKQAGARVRRLRKHRDYLMGLYDGKHAVCDDPDSCDVCGTWGAPHDATGCEHCRDDCDGIAMPPNTRNQPAEPR